VPIADAAEMRVERGIAATDMFLCWIAGSTMLGRSTRIPAEPDTNLIAKAMLWQSRSGLRLNAAA